MVYSHFQPSNASNSMYGIGIIGLINFMTINVVAGITKIYGLFGTSSIFFWMIGYLVFAKYYKKLTIKDENDKYLYVRFTDKSFDNNSCCCIPQKSLSYGIKVPYENIKTYCIIKSNSCDLTIDGYNCCNNKIIYNADAFECGKTTLIELKLKESINFNLCGCLVKTIYLTYLCFYIFDI